MTKNPVASFFENTTEYVIFASRWIQAPMYLGLVAASGLYIYKFFEEFWHIAQTVQIVSEVEVMLGILRLIDASMVLNLLVIVIVGGYSIFTSKIDFSQHEDRPHWLDHLDAGRLKIKLATSLASISGVHLLASFIDIHQAAAGTRGTEELKYEIIIHIIFIISALLLAWIEQVLAATDRITAQTMGAEAHHNAASKSDSH